MRKLLGVLGGLCLLAGIAHGAIAYHKWYVDDALGRSTLRMLDLVSIRLDASALGERARLAMEDAHHAVLTRHYARASAFERKALALLSARGAEEAKLRRAELAERQRRRGYIGGHSARYFGLAAVALLVAGCLLCDIGLRSPAAG